MLKRCVLLVLLVEHHDGLNTVSNITAPTSSTHPASHTRSPRSKHPKAWFPRISPCLFNSNLYPDDRGSSWRYNLSLWSNLVGNPIRLQPSLQACPLSTQIRISDEPGNSIDAGHRNRACSNMDVEFEGSDLEGDSDGDMVNGSFFPGMETILQECQEGR